MYEKNAVKLDECPWCGGPNCTRIFSTENGHFRIDHSCEDCKCEGLSTHGDVRMPKSFSSNPDNKCKGCGGDSFTKEFIPTDDPMKFIVDHRCNSCGLLRGPLKLMAEE